jgi:hypothetical protein
MSALEIEVKPIPKSKADEIVKKHHYSGKVVQNSQLCFGVWYKGVLMGAMQFGPPTDKRKILPLVKDSGWNEMLELNRMAFSDHLPRFSESRAISLAFKWMKKNAPHIKWVVSFADGTQCGHGTIYQASNFKLSQIKENSRLIELPNGEKIHLLSMDVSKGGSKYSSDMKKNGMTSVKEYLDKFHNGWKPLTGYMYRYIYFITKDAEKRYTGEFVPFAKIKELGIQMYKGEWVNNGIQQS